MYAELGSNMSANIHSESAIQTAIYIIMYMQKAPTYSAFKFIYACLMIALIKFANI